MRRLLQLTLLVMAAVALTFLVATPSHALHKNPGNTLVCGGCHTMHNSQGNTSLGGIGGTASSGGSIILLRGIVATRAEIHNLCLQCHGSNGQQSTAVFPNEYDGGTHPAPKVYIDSASGTGIGFVGQAFASIGAGGDFSNEISGDSSGWSAVFGTGDTVGVGYGHSLGMTNVRPPGFENNEDSSGATSLDYFTCTSCHDPHGAYNADTTYALRYRNLRPIPSGSLEPAAITLNTGVRSYVGFGGCVGGDADFETGINGGNDSTAIWPVYHSGTAAFTAGADASTCASEGGEVNSYAVSAGSASDGIANWCAACHDYWHEGNIANNGPVTSTLGDDWRRHPVDNLLFDATRRSGGGTTIVDPANYFTTGSGARLPIASTTETIYYMVEGVTDPANSKVFCLSCHFAHGGPYFDLLRWDYLSSVNTGSTQVQLGNALSSMVGCQLCHNR